MPLYFHVPVKLSLLYVASMDDTVPRPMRQRPSRCCMDESRHGQKAEVGVIADRLGNSDLNHDVLGPCSESRRERIPFGNCVAVVALLRKPRIARGEPRSHSSRQCGGSAGCAAPERSPWKLAATSRGDPCFSQQLRGGETCRDSRYPAPESETRRRLVIVMTWRDGMKIILHVHHNHQVTVIRVTLHVGCASQPTH